MADTKSRSQSETGDAAAFLALRENCDKADARASALRKIEAGVIVVFLIGAIATLLLAPSASLAWLAVEGVLGYVALLVIQLASNRAADASAAANKDLVESMQATAGRTAALVDRQSERIQQLDARTGRTPLAEERRAIIDRLRPFGGPRRLAMTVVAVSGDDETASYASSISDMLSAAGIATGGFIKGNPDTPTPAAPGVRVVIGPRTTKESLSVASGIAEILGGEVVERADVADIEVWVGEKPSAWASGAALAQANAELASVRARMSDRHLSDDQHRKLIEVLRSLGPHRIAIKRFSRHGEVAALATELWEAFGDGGWGVPLPGPTVEHRDDVSVRGVAVVFSPHDDPRMTQIAEQIAAVGFAIPHPEWSMPRGSDPPIELWVGDRP